MGYPTYDSYQETKIPWLPKYPSNWEVRRLKFMSSIQNGIDYKHVEVNQSEEGYPVYGSGGVFRKASSYLYDGESVLYGRKGTIDKPLYVTGAFWTVDTMFYSEIGESVFGNYMFYSALTTQFQYLATQTALPSITQNDLSNYWLCFPSYSEQTKIAHFLDYKTNQVDRLIDKKKALIEKLNEQRIAVITQAVTKGLNSDALMKNSEIDWLGKVPKHWEVIKLRYCTNLVTSGSRGWAKFFSDAGDVFIRITNLTRDSITLDSSDVKRVDLPLRTEGERTQTQSGDVLISITADLGSVAVIPEQFEAAYVSQHISLVRPELDKVIPKWLAFSIFSHMGKAQLLGAGYGGTKQQLSLRDIKELTLLCPPAISEQESIIGWLETELLKLNNMVAVNQQTIEKLEEYRTALITAAVTGKIDVRNVEIPEQDAA